VPTDAAILRLEKKPHLNENGREDTESSSRYNIERFLSSHIIPVSSRFYPGLSRVSGRYGMEFGRED